MTQMSHTRPARLRGGRPTSSRSHAPSNKLGSTDDPSESYLKAHVGRFEDLDRPFFGNRTTKLQQGFGLREAFARLQRSGAKALVVAEALSWCAVAGATCHPLAG